ncbi:hypothetical protein A2U01_0080207 [Trifolium medium]|uniref:Uncharacterized protein n=1 Tax=Trifolium medium TaxID=97028 RepID=A0A392TDG1_9FABA|nr:hypothetical protein [Trifolium medium]
MCEGARAMASMEKMLVGVSGQIRGRRNRNGGDGRRHGQ